MSLSAGAAMNHRRICFFNSTKAWGGGEKWHFDIAARLHETHGNVFVVAGTGSELGSRLKAAEIPHCLIAIGNLSFLNPFKILKLVSLFRNEKPDTLIMNLPSDLKAAGIAARLSGVRRIIYRRGSAINVRNTLLNRFLFRYVIDDIIANSGETARTILTENPKLFPAEKIHVIYNGINWEKFDLQEQAPEPPLQKSCIVLGNAGRLEPQKGQELLIQVARRLKDKGYDFQILIAGEGRLKETLQQNSVKEGVSENLHFLGFVDNMPQFFRSIDVFLLPSHWEGFGYVIAEAMYCEKPVVAFNVSSNPEIVSNTETGYLVEHGDLEAFVEKTEILIHDVGLRRQMGQKGRLSAMERFSIHHTLNKIEQLLYPPDNEL